MMAGPRTSGSYPTGAGPESQAESLKPGSRQAPAVVEGSERPFQIDHVAPAAVTMTSGTVVTASTDARQLPPSSLSSDGCSSSIEFPGASPTVGQGNPSP